MSHQSVEDDSFDLHILSEYPYETNPSYNNDSEPPYLTPYITNASTHYGYDDNHLLNQFDGDSTTTTTTAAELIHFRQNSEAIFMLEDSSTSTSKNPSAFQSPAQTNPISPKLPQNNTTRITELEQELLRTQERLAASQSQYNALELLYSGLKAENVLLSSNFTTILARLSSLEASQEQITKNATNSSSSSNEHYQALQGTSHQVPAIHPDNPSPQSSNLPTPQSPTLSSSLTPTNDLLIPLDPSQNASLLISHPSSVAHTLSLPIQSPNGSPHYSSQNAINLLETRLLASALTEIRLEDSTCSVESNSNDLSEFQSSLRRNDDILLEQPPSYSEVELFLTNPVQDPPQRKILPQGAYKGHKHGRYGRTRHRTTNSTSGSQNVGINQQQLSFAQLMDRIYAKHNNNAQNVLISSTTQFYIVTTLIMLLLVMGSLLGSVYISETQQTKQTILEFVNKHNINQNPTHDLTPINFPPGYHHHTYFPLHPVNHPTSSDNFPHHAALNLDSLDNTNNSSLYPPRFDFEAYLATYGSNLVVPASTSSQTPATQYIPSPTCQEGDERVLDDDQHHSYLVNSTNGGKMYPTVANNGTGSGNMCSYLNQDRSFHQLYQSLLEQEYYNSWDLFKKKKSAKDEKMTVISRNFTPSSPSHALLPYHVLNPSQYRYEHRENYPYEYYQQHRAEIERRNDQQQLPPPYHSLPTHHTPTTPVASATPTPLLSLFSTPQQQHSLIAALQSSNKLCSLGDTWDLYPLMQSVSSSSTPLVTSAETTLQFIIAPTNTNYDESLSNGVSSLIETQYTFDMVLPNHTILSPTAPSSLFHTNKENLEEFDNSNGDEDNRYCRSLDTVVDMELFGAINFFELFKIIILRSIGGENFDANNREFFVDNSPLIYVSLKSIEPKTPLPHDDTAIPQHSVVTQNNGNLTNNLVVHQQQTPFYQTQVSAQILLIKNQ